jgi:metallo-beta-lactamase family protein
MHLEFFGAANGVTGSCHRLVVQGRDILLDCGLYQGRREEANAINRKVPEWLLKAHALVLSHAHIDHSGNIPTVVARGFNGNIYCTPATRDLASVMLRDSAMIQEQDAAYLNKRAAREGRSERLEPLYTQADAEKAVGLMFSVPLYRSLDIAPGVRMRLHDAGHVLGSSVIELDLEEGAKKTKLVFTGDLGRTEVPLLRDPEVVEGVDVLLTESTYGDRLHPPFLSMDDELGEIVRRTIGRGGRVYIPSFALERAQEIIVALNRLRNKHAIPEVPVYVDSPLSIAITEIYKLHPESLDETVRKEMSDGDSPFALPTLVYISEIRASQKLQERDEPCIVIAGSGMCEGGRIVHHLAKGLSNSKNSVAIVGFQAQHTLGRRLVERRRKVRVLGLERDVYAEIYTLNGFSAHADQDDILRYVAATRAGGSLRNVALVHGEDGPRRVLKKKLEDSGVPGVVIAEKGSKLEL